MKEEPPQTIRPLHPVVVALQEGIFLQRMFDLMAPGDWYEETEAGFWWVPSRLRHDIEVFEVEAQSGQAEVCRSTFLLCTDVSDADEALVMAHYLNQRSIGGACIVDEEERTMHFTSSVRLDPADWFSAFMFEMTVAQQVGMLENFAPRLAGMVGGKVPDPVHPVHGRRITPDQFIAEATLVTLAPEAACGIWWSEREIEMFRRALRFQLQQGGHDDVADQIDPDSYDSSVTSMTNLFTEFVFEGERWNGLTVQEGRHPEFGQGVELLVSTSLVIEPDLGLDGPPQSGYPAIMLANALNTVEHRTCSSALTLGAWTTWRGQLCYDTFLIPEPLAALQSNCGAHAGEVLAILAAHAFEHVEVLRIAEADYDLFGTARVNVQERRWAGVRSNAGHHSLLVDADEVFEPLVAELPLNEAIDPVELGHEVYALQTETTFVSMGIFNPSGPSVGSLEVAVNYTLGRALLIERLRHPHSPAVRVHALLDMDGFMSIDPILEDVVAGLQWSPFDWWDTRTTDVALVAAMNRGLKRFVALRPDCDFDEEARSLLGNLDDPWVRLGDRSTPQPRLFAGSDPVESWIAAITDPRNIDNHCAYIRSAWEGARAWVAGGAGDSAANAQAIADRISSIVATRKTGMNGSDPTSTDA